MTQIHPFSPLTIAPNFGTILFTPCPGTQTADLPTSLQQLANAGASAIITLMPAAEMQRNQVTAMPDHCAQLGLQWFHLPIEDDSVPTTEFAHAWQACHEQLHALLKSGKHLAIHCKGGTGRTGLVAAQLLLEMGIGVDEVITMVRSVRPKALQIPAQLQYIQQQAGLLAAGD